MFEFVKHLTTLYMNTHLGHYNKLLATPILKALLAQLGAETTRACCVGLEANYFSRKNRRRMHDTATEDAPPSIWRKQIPSHSLPLDPHDLNCWEISKVALACPLTKSRFRNYYREGTFMVSCGEHYSNMFTCLHLKTKTHAKAKVGYIFVNFLLNFSFFFFAAHFYRRFWQRSGRRNREQHPWRCGHHAPLCHSFGKSFRKMMGRKAEMYNIQSAFLARDLLKSKPFFFRSASAVAIC